MEKKTIVETNDGFFMEYKTLKDACMMNELYYPTVKSAINRKGSYKSDLVTVRYINQEPAKSEPQCLESDNNGFLERLLRLFKHDRNR